MMFVLFWVKCCSVVCRKCTVENLSITVGFYTLFPAHDIPLALEMKVFSAYKRWPGINPRGDPCTFPQSHFITLIQCTLHPVWHNLFILFSIVCRGAGMEVIGWFSSPCDREEELEGSEDDNEKVRWLPVLSSVFEPSYSVISLWSAAGPAKTPDYPSLTAQTRTCHYLRRAVNTQSGANMLNFSSTWSRGVGSRKFSRHSGGKVQQLLYNLSCEVWWVGGQRIPTLNQKFYFSVLFVKYWWLFYRIIRWRRGRF